jgi:hypothetical protein
LGINHHKIMKTTKRNLTAWAGICAACLIAVAALTALAQTAPVLSITPSGTNQFSINITNNIGMATFDLQGTPLLANPDYPWTWAAIGTPGQTNFVVTAVYDSGFYRAILDTNSIPLWEAADPNNPSLGALSITIDTPINGSTLH